ncbi:MAG: site-2 protease family protein, partial [Candidatus Melainabacteria bacterium]|nr:site-2 protease family protein [Candidatus Melainabacteria bacterium]
MEKMPADQATDAWVALAGPLVGGVAAAAFYYYGVQTQSIFFMAAGSVGLFLNLLQLIPAKPLDGGFVINAISKWLLIPGIGVLFAYTFYFKSFLFGIVAVIAFFNLVHQFKNPNEPHM